MARSLDFSQNQILLNPNLPEGERKQLTQLAREGFEKLGLKHHVALATSGTTQAQSNSQKIVFLSEYALMASAQAVNQHLQVSASDVWGASLPRYHVGGLGIFLRADLKGRAVEHTGPWEPHLFVQFLSANQVTLASLVPTQVYDLVHAQLRAPPSLRAVVVGGAALHSDLYLKARQWGWPLLPSYGMTETCSQIATAEISDLEKNEMSLPKLLNHAQILFEDSKASVASPSLLTAYGQVQEGLVQFWDPKNALGHFALEDQLQEVPNQRIRVLGRSRDFFKVSGESLLLSQLQQALEKILIQKNKTATDFYLSYVEDPRTGNKVVLYTTLQDSVDDVCEAYKKEVLPVAKIREVIQVKEIPRTDLGKVQIEKLRGMK